MRKSRNRSTQEVLAAMRERSAQFEQEGARATVVVRHTFADGQHRVEKVRG